MYSAGETVIYGSLGVCKIKDIAKMSLGGESKVYCVLIPVNDIRSVVYVPTDNDILMSRIHPILSPDEVNIIICSAAPEKIEWINSDAERKQFCGETLKSGDRVRIMQMIAMLYERREVLRTQKKHFHITDERFLKEAIKLLHEEFAYVLGIDTDEVPGYIESRIKKSS